MCSGVDTSAPSFFAPNLHVRADSSFVSIAAHPFPGLALDGGGGGVGFIQEAGSSITGGGNGITFWTFENESMSFESGGDITGNSGHGVHLRNLSPNDKEINVLQTGGTISGKLYHGFRVDNNGTASVLVNTTGKIIGALDGISIGQVSTNKNKVHVIVDGTAIGGSGSGVAVGSIAGSLIEVGSAGFVSADSGVAIRDGQVGGLVGYMPRDNLGGDAVIDNRGYIEGDIVLGLGDDTVNLYNGTVDGYIYGDDRDDDESRDGLANHEGNDTFNWTGGTLTGGFHGQDGSDTATVSTASFTGNEVLDGGDDVSGTDGFVDTLTFTSQSFVAKGANILNWEKVVIENGTLSFSDGTLTTGSEDGLGLIVASGGTVNGGSSFNLTGNLDIQTDGTFAGQGDGTGLFEVSSNVINAGSLSFGDGAAGDIFKISGNYTGANGIITLDTNLGDDSSATDLLVVTGDASGTGSLKVVNAGGPGALTTADGIKVIEVGGASDAQFTLIGDYSHDGQQAVVGGAYAYKLYHNGVTDPVDGNWYLRSELKDKPVDPGDPTDPMDPDEPIDVPLYQAGASVYDTYPQILLGLNGVTTLQQRVGNRSWAGNGNRIIAQGADAIGSPYAAPEEAGTFTEGNGVWGRIEGAHNRIDPRSSTTSVAYDYNTYKLHAGLDGMLLENEAGRLIGGFSVHYARGSANTWSVYDADNGGGKIRTDGYGLGSSLTWYGDNGLYLDAQVQATWYDSDLDFNGGNSSLVDGNHGFGYALSLESGKRLALNETWSLTPQAQLTWSSVNFDRFTDTFGSSVSLDRADSLQGRLGLALNHQNAWYNASGNINRTNLYGIGNLYYEFLEGTKVSVDGTSLANQNQRLWGGIGLGGSYNWNNDKYSVYGEGSINASLANFADSYSYKATTGFKVRW